MAAAATKDRATGQVDTLYLGGRAFKGVRTAFLGGVGLLAGFVVALMLRCVGGLGSDDDGGDKDEPGVDLIHFEGQRSYGGHEQYQAGRYGEPAHALSAQGMQGLHQGQQPRQQTARHQYDVLDANGQPEDEFNRPMDDYADVEM